MVIRISVHIVLPLSPKKESNSAGAGLSRYTFFHLPANEQTVDKEVA